MPARASKDNAWTDNQVIFHVANDLYTTSGAHYGSRLLFDKQDHLFFAMGERNGNNPNFAQDLTKPLGKILRMNDDGTAPKDNPFVNTPGADPRIWTYGHRNPEGLAWDPVSGALTCGRIQNHCSLEFDKCSTSADCCDPGLQCINSVCTLVIPH